MSRRKDHSVFRTIIQEVFSCSNKRRSDITKGSCTYAPLPLLRPPHRHPPQQALPRTSLASACQRPAITSCRQETEPTIDSRLPASDLRISLLGRWQSLWNDRLQKWEFAGPAEKPGLGRGPRAWAAGCFACHCGRHGAPNSSWHHSATTQKGLVPWT